MFTRRLKNPLMSLPGIAVISMLFMLFSCEKPEGPGGRGSIKGQVMVRTFDKGFRIQQAEFPAANEDVYIMYGDEQTISDDQATTPDGRFEFQYLSKGDYTIFLFSEDSTGQSTSGFVVVEHTVNLSSTRQVADLGKIYINKTIEVDGGKANISGQVMQVIYSQDLMSVTDTIPGQDIDVFLLYEDDKQYSGRIRTLYDGSFTFTNMIKGNYTVMVYSEDVNGGKELIPVKKNINVATIRGDFNAGILYSTMKD